MRPQKRTVSCWREECRPGPYNDYGTKFIKTKKKKRKDGRQSDTIEVTINRCAKLWRKRYRIKISLLYSSLFTSLTKVLFFFCVSIVFPYLVYRFSVAHNFTLIMSGKIYFAGVFIPTHLNLMSIRHPLTYGHIWVYYLIVSKLSVSKSVLFPW